MRNFEEARIIGYSVSPVHHPGNHSAKDIAAMGYSVCIRGPEIFDSLSFLQFGPFLILPLEHFALVPTSI